MKVSWRLFACKEHDLRGNKAEIMESRRRKSALARNLQPYEAGNLYTHTSSNGIIFIEILLRHIASSKSQNARTKVNYSGTNQEKWTSKAEGQALPQRSCHRGGTESCALESPSAPPRPI